MIESNRSKIEGELSKRTAQLAQVNEELRKNEEKYRTLVEDANSIILRMDTEASPVTVRLGRLLHDIAAMLRTQLADGLDPADPNYLDKLASANEQLLKYLTGSLRFLVLESRRFDRTIFVPYHFNNGSGLSFETFQMEYIALTNRTIRFVSGWFAVDVGDFHFVPKVWADDVGKPALTAAKSTADFVVSELQRNLFHGDSPCTLENMRRTAQGIREYLEHGNRSIAHDRLRLGLSYDALRRAGLDLQGSCNRPVTSDQGLGAGR